MEVMSDTKLANQSEQGKSTGLLIFVFLCLESLLVTIAFHTPLSVLYYVLPFRLIVWGLFFDQCLRKEALPSVGELLLLALPYIATCSLASGLIFPFTLAKLSYYSGLFLSIVYVGFVQVYLRVRSLSVTFELLCLLCFFTMAVMCLFFYDAMVGLWYKMLLPYQKMFVTSGLGTTEAQMQTLTAQIAGTMSSSVVVNYFLVPACVSVIVVAYCMFYQKSDRLPPILQDWLAVRMSWLCFYVAMPLFFASYGMMLLRSFYPNSQILMSWAVVLGFFEIARFIPSIAGLSYIHHRVHEKFQDLPKKFLFWSGFTTMLFYAFGYFFYPMCSFIGLIDRVLDLRQSKDNGKQSKNLR